LARGCLWVRRLRRRGTERVEQAWLEIVDDLRLRLGISRPVRLFKSALVEVPTVIGWMRPVILLPASALTGLTPEQLEAILAHELAHVRRVDYLVNACQCVLETLMFYHPAVWWISRCIREEREQCCDDLVVQVCTNRLAYARALAVLAESGHGLQELAFAASGAPLLARIRRLVGAGGETGPATGREMAGLTLLAASLPLILAGVWLILAAPSPSFQATARIRLCPEGTDSGAPAGVRAALAVRDPYAMQTETQIVQSDMILGKVVDSLALRDVWGRKDAKGEKLARIEAIGLLKSGVSLRLLANTSLIEIQASSEKPQEAAEIANAVARAYQEYRVSRQANLANGGLASMIELRKQLDAEINEMNTNVDQLRVKLSIPDSTALEYPRAPLLTAETLQHINSLRIDASQQLVSQESLLHDLKGLAPDVLAQTLPTVIQENFLGSLLEKKTLAEQSLLSLENDKGSLNPDVIKARASRDDLEKRIRATVEGDMKGLETKVHALGVSLTNLNEQVAQAIQADIQKASNSQPYFYAKRHLEEKITFRPLLESKIAVEQVDSTSAALVELIDAAVPPRRPISPDHRPLAGGFIGSGVLLDILGAILLRSRPKPVA
jgi:uncharacterized protein involved in exopolysaccharide biosynthesis